MSRQKISLGSVFTFFFCIHWGCGRKDLHAHELQLLLTYAQAISFVRSLARFRLKNVGKGGKKLA